MNQRFDDVEVSAVYQTPFGGLLFNAYTLERKEGSSFLFSNRLRIVRAMLRAMLDTEDEIVREHMSQAEGSPQP